MWDVTDIELIETAWDTPRLYIRDASLETDLHALEALSLESAYLGEWDGQANGDTEHIYQCLTEGEIPPGGHRDYYTLQSVFDRTSEEMIGYFSVYHGYPTADTLWIMFLFFHPEVQSMGYGRELMQQLFSHAAKKGYRKVSLLVALKNWKAIRFWTSLGASRIVKITGDKQFGPDQFAHMVLEADLR